MIEIGKTYYFVVHIYYQVIGTVVAIHGTKNCTLDNVVKVDSHRGGWEEFLRNGITDATVWHKFPDGVGINGWMVDIPWKHKVPRR